MSRLPRSRIVSNGLMECIKKTFHIHLGAKCPLYFILVSVSSVAGLLCQELFFMPICLPSLFEPLHIQVARISLGVVAFCGCRLRE